MRSRMMMLLNVLVALNRPDLATPASLPAQIARGRINGTVKDTTGPSFQVIITSADATHRIMQVGIKL